MNNKLKRILALILIAALSISCIASADDDNTNKNTGEGEQNRSSAYISSYSGSIKATVNGKFNIVFTITGTGTMTEIGATYIRIFKNGTQVDSFWYTSSGRSGMMAYNTFIMGDTESYQGVSGATYYAKISFYAKNSSGYDIKVYTTASVTV